MRHRLLVLLLVGCGPSPAPPAARAPVPTTPVVRAPKPMPPVDPRAADPDEDPFEVYADDLGSMAIDVIDQCVAENDTGLKLEVEVEYRVDTDRPDGAWIVVDAPTTTPVIASVEDCIADRLARTPVDLADEELVASGRLGRTTFHAGIRHREESRIEIHGKIEIFE